MEMSRYVYDGYYPQLFSKYVELVGNEITHQLGGHFGEALRRNDLRKAWQLGDFQNRYFLILITGKSPDELEKIAYQTYHPDEQITYHLDQKLYTPASRGGTTGIMTVDEYRAAHGVYDGR